jgi:hypothetical protein
MGAVAPEVLISTFFSFNPELVYPVLPTSLGHRRARSLKAPRRNEGEGQTDLLAAMSSVALGEEGCVELLALVRPSSKWFSELLFR